MGEGVRHVVIGGGVVGLAVASRLSRLGSTLLLEKNTRVGEETSSRNSEVIHAGLYYPNESLKTKLCLRGKELLYQLADKHPDVELKKIGKFIIAQNEGEHNYLLNLKKKADELNVPLDFVPMNKFRELEPNVHCKEALFSPTTGIINSHSLMAHLESSIESNGSDIALNTLVVGLRRENGKYLVDTKSTTATQSDTFTVEADVVVNCAGLWADRVAGLLNPQWLDKYKLHYFKGHYYGYTGKPLVNTLIYPIPDKHLASLGIHATVDLAGRMRFGPDIWFSNSNTNYSVPKPTDPEYNERLDNAYAAIKTYIPNLKRELLYFDYAGIRPKLSGEGQPFRDFVIEEESASGYPNFVNLIGIESPGLTSSLAIAELVEEKLK